MANYKLLLALLMATTASFVAGRSLYLLERSSDLFDDVDANEDGFVTPEELAEYLKITSPETGKNFSIIASQYVAAVDSGDQDGKLNREEFSKLPLQG